MINKIEKLQDLKGRSVRDLTLHDKARIMSAVLTSEFSNPDLAKRIAKSLKGDEHKCGPKTCHNTCHYHLKAKSFDLLWARWMI